MILILLTSIIFFSYYQICIIWSTYYQIKHLNLLDSGTKNRVKYMEKLMNIDVNMFYGTYKNNNSSISSYPLNYNVIILQPNIDSFTIAHELGHIKLKHHFKTNLLFGFYGLLFGWIITNELSPIYTIFELLILMINFYFCYHRLYYDSEIEADMEALKYLTYSEIEQSIDLISRFNDSKSWFPWHPSNEKRISYCKKQLQYIT